MFTWHHLPAWAAAAILVCLTGGCQKGGNPPPPETQHIQRVARLYMEYFQSKKMQQSPKNVDDLKAFAKTLDKQRLTGMGIDDLDAAFVSPRDKKPYVVLPAAPMGMPSGGKQGAAPQGMEAMSRAIIVHEQEGVSGKRMVVFMQGGSAVEMDEAGFQSIMGKK